MVKYKIAISGKANSGKSTTAKLFENTIPGKSKIIALADPMKQIVKTIFPEARDECLYGPSELRSEIIDKKYINMYGSPLTHRQALLAIGAFGRSYNNDIWLNMLVSDANSSKSINTYIVSDARFSNEFSYLKQSGFTMIRLIRKNSTHINDVSETEQDSIDNSEFDYVIYNDGTIDNLQQEVKNISHKLMGLM